jgi:hypothetical protein
MLVSTSSYAAISKAIFGKTGKRIAPSSVGRYRAWLVNQQRKPDRSRFEYRVLDVLTQIRDEIRRIRNVKTKNGKN